MHHSPYSTLLWKCIAPVLILALDVLLRFPVLSGLQIIKRGLRGLIQHWAILRKDSRCQEESNHQHLICRNFSSYINCWLQSPLPTGQGLAYEKRKLFISQSIPFYEVNLIIWMGAKSIYLTYRILIFFIIVYLSLLKCG